MGKKKDTSPSEWSEAISASVDQDRKRDNKLDPSKGRIRYISDYAREILKIADYIEFTSALAHEGFVEFEVAQKILDFQRERMNETIESLKMYLKPREQQEGANGVRDEVSSEGNRPAAD